MNYITNFGSDEYTRRFVYVFLSLVAFQTVLVLMPSGMCQTVSTVPPSGVQIQTMVSGNAKVTLYWNLGSAGGSNFTDLHYSTDGGTTWALVAAQPSQSGSSDIFTESDGTALVNDSTYTFIIVVGTEAFPDYATNIPSSGFTVSPSSSAPVATAPQIITSNLIDDLEFGVYFELGNPGASEFNAVFYSTNNGVNWTDTELTGPDWGGEQFSGGRPGYFLINKTSNGGAALTLNTQYLVKFAATTVASATKLASDLVPMTTGSGPGSTVPPGDITISYVSAGVDYLDVNYKLPISMGSGTFTGVYFSIDGGSTFALATDQIQDNLFRVQGLELDTCYNGGLIVTTTDYPEALDAFNFVDFSGCTTSQTDPIKAEAPILQKIDPGNRSLTVTFSLTNPGSSTFQTLYYKIDGVHWVESGIADLSNTNTFVITSETEPPATLLTNGTTYEVYLRVTTIDFPSYTDALDSNMVEGTPASSAVRPDKPTITDVYTYSDFSTMNNPWFQFNVNLGSNGGSPFLGVFYTTDGTNYKVISPQQIGTGRVIITEESGGVDQYLTNGPYNVKVVSKTFAFNYTGNTNSDVFSMNYNGTVTAPDAPVLNSVEENLEGNVILDFTLLDYGSDVVSLWYCTNVGTGDNWAEIGNVQSGGLRVSEDSLKGPFETGSYVIKIALTNSASRDPATAPQSGSLTLAYSALALSRSRNILQYDAVVSAGSLGTTICEHENWKKFQTTFRVTSIVLALTVPSLALWRLKVSPVYPLILALIFWLLSHAVRDLRDKNVTTEYKFAVRWEYYIERLALWLSYGCLIAAPVSLFSRFNANPLVKFNLRSPKVIQPKIHT